MHELSLADEVIRLAQAEAGKNNAHRVSEITIEVGSFCGVEPEVFESALEILSEGSILENAHVNIIRIMGIGFCHTCGREYEMNRRTDTCPGCNAFPSEIRRGTEFRVASLVVEED